MLSILYLPLDERACNLRFPQLLAEMTEDVTLVVPPTELLGKLKHPADVHALWDWVFANAGRCQQAILSVDMLLYGNIVNSRLHHRTVAECDALLNRFRELKAAFPALTLHAFNLVARVAAYNFAGEDPDYWATHGYAIWRYAYLTDKDGRGMADEAERSELLALTQSIPKQYLDDFLARRVVCRHVNLSVLDLLQEGVFEDLVIPKDDNAEFGYAAMDHHAVAKKTRELGLMHRVMIYPGADETGCVLFARVFCAYKGFVPRVLVKYSSLLGPTVVPLYEDRPLHESIKAQIASIGGYVVDSASDSNLLLAVHSPGVKMTEASSQDDKDVTYYSHHCLHEFFRFIQHYRKSSERACALADVCFANGGDKEMLSHAKSLNLFSALDAYGGWNTAMNTVGVCLAHGAIAAYLKTRPDLTVQRERSQEFLLRKLIEDWLYQAVLLTDAARHPEQYVGRPIDPYALGEEEATLRDLTQDLICRKIWEVFPDGFLHRSIRFDGLRFPWSRLFDIDFDIALIPR